MLKAALSHFIAERDRAVANLNNLLRNPAGIGGHVDLVGEVIILVREIESANSCVSIINDSLSEGDPERDSETTE